MTTKPIAPPAATPTGQFPDFPPRDDMQNVLYLYKPGYVAALHRRLAAPDTVVIGEAPIGWDTSQRRGLLIPDLLIAFNVNQAMVVEQKGYAISDQGKPPDFVLEIASKSTSGRDETDKRSGYAAYGVPEYWRFDDTGGEYYSTHLAGDRLVNGAYQSIGVNEVGNARHWGYSEVLGLYLCWEYGYLRWYDPAAQGYLETYDQAADGRLAAEERNRQLEAESATERDRRLAAEARNRQLEAEIRRLQNQ